MRIKGLQNRRVDTIPNNEEAEINKNGMIKIENNQEPEQQQITIKPKIPGRSTKIVPQIRLCGDLYG